MIRPILQKPNLELLRPSRPVERLKDTVAELVRDLLDTRAHHHCAGLSAVQIGVHLRIVAFDPTFVSGFKIMINPEIISRGSQRLEAPEGCMSIAGGVPRFMVKRHEIVTVRFLDREAVERVVIAKRFGARLIQHELDHLEGKLIA